MLFHNIRFLSDNGATTAIASISRNPMSEGPDEVIAGSDNCRKVLEGLRNLPFGSVIVSVYYPSLDRRIILNQPKDNEMDLSHLYAERPENKRDALPIRLLAPLPVVVPTDELVEFVTVETIQDILNAEEHKVLLFGEDKEELLDCLVNYADLFKVTPMVLSGLPSAEYSARFESKTYSLERVSYSSLVNDLIERKRVNAALASENQTAYQKEKAQYTRTSGHVKELTGVQLAGAPATVEPAEADE